MIDIPAPVDVVADALDIESAIHLVPVIFMIRAGTYLLMKMAGIGTMKLHRTRPNLMKIVFYCRRNLFLIATRMLVRLANIFIIDKF